jgi:hypothetical protein
MRGVERGIPNFLGGLSFLSPWPPFLLLRIIILYSEIINKNKKDFLKGEAAQPAQLG